MVRGASLSRGRGVKTGTTIAYRDSQAGRTTFTVQRRAAGVRRGKRCVARPRHGSKGKHLRGYTRVISVGSFSHADVAGSVHLRFSGRVAGRPLAPGRYVLRAVVGNTAGLVATAVSTTFTIKR